MTKNLLFYFSIILFCLSGFNFNYAQETDWLSGLKQYSMDVAVKQNGEITIEHHLVNLGEISKIIDKYLPKLKLVDFINENLPDDYCNLMLSYNYFSTSSSIKKIYYGSVSVKVTRYIQCIEQKLLCYNHEIVFNIIKPTYQTVANTATEHTDTLIKDLALLYDLQN